MIRMFMQKESFGGIFIIQKLAEFEINNFSFLSMRYNMSSHKYLWMGHPSAFFRLTTKK